MPTPAEQLQSAYRFVQQGQYTEAQQILLPMVRQSPANADAWWLLATSYTNDPARAMYALEQMLRLRPDDSRARDMLDRLRSSGISSRSPFDSTSSSDPMQAAPARDDFSRGFGDFADSSSTTYGNSGSTDPFGQPAYKEKPKNDSYSSPVPPVANYYIPPRKGTHPCIMILAFIGGLTLLGCALCAGLFFSFADAVGPAMENAIGTFQADPDVERFFEAMSTPGAFQFDPEGVFSDMPDTLPTSADNQGVLEYGQSEEGRIGDDEYHVYTFQGDAGDSVTITLEAVGIGSSFDAEVGLYRPDKSQLIINDDASPRLDNRVDSRIIIVLPTDGIYSILVGEHFGQGGTYRLSLEQGPEASPTP